MIKSTHGCAACLLLLISALPLVVHASGVTVRLAGSVYNGVPEEQLQAGGSTFQINVPFPVFAGYDDARLRGLFTEVLASCYVMELNETLQVPDAETNSWVKYFSQLIEKSSIDVLDDGRSARLTLDPCPYCVIEEVLVIVPHLPPTAFRELALLGGGKGVRNDLWNNAFILTPKPMIRMRDVGLEHDVQPLYITGSTIEIPLSVEEIRDVELRVKVMEGLTCTNTRNAVTQGNAWDDDKQSYRFIANRGGMISLCFAPFHNRFPELMIKVGGSLRVAGPEGVWTEPQQIQSGMEFTGTLYGTDLSEYDVLMITSRQCDEFPSGGDLLPWLSFSSSSRAHFFGVLDHEGIYHMCYRRDRSSMFVKIAKIVVEGSDDGVIEGDGESVVVDKVTRLLNRTTIGHLKVERSGRLLLGRESLNVTSFVWSGGTIVGHGNIHCLGVTRIRLQNYDPLTVSFLLHNYGDMTIDVWQLNLEGDGAIHNYGNLTISISSSGRAGGTSWIRSLGHINVLVNRGGTIRINSPNKEHPALCRTRILNMEGTLLLTGNLIIVDMSNRENAQLFLGKDTRVTVSNARLRGEITLTENSELTLAKGCSLVSTTVRGNRSRIAVTDDSILLEFLTVTGDVAVDVVGQKPDDSEIFIAISGTNRFAAGTFLNLRRVHLVAGTSAAKLITEGIFTVEFDSVILTGDALIQVGHRALIYGRGSEYLASVGERNSLVSLVVQRNATLAAVDMEMEGAIHTKRNVFFTFSHSIVIEGRVLLQGCWAIPLGGVIGGVVKPLGVDEDVVNIISHLVDAGWDFSIPMLSRQYASFILQGEFYLHGGTQLELDEIIMRSAVVRGDGAVLINVHGLLTVDRGSRFSVQRGLVLNASLIYLEGVLEADTALKPLIYSDVEIAKGGGLKLYSAPTHPCLATLVISGDVRRGFGSLVECHAVSLLGAVDTQINMRERERTDSMRRMIAGLPSDVECPKSYLLEESEKYFLLQYFLGNVRYDPPPNVPTPRNMIVAGVAFMLLGIMTLHLFLWVWGLSWREWYVDIRREPPLRLNLPWLDFTSHGANYCVLLAILFNALQISMASFHPHLPLPIGFMSLLTLRSVHLIMSHHRFRSDLQLRLVSISVIIWGLAAIPLIFSSRRAASVKRCGKNVQAILRMFSKIYYVLRLVALFFVVPIQSMVLDFLACNTFLSDLPTCEAARGAAFLPLTATLTLTFMMPWANLLESKFLQCDLHFKSSVLFTEHSVLMMEISMWKVFYQSPVMMLVNNMVFEGFRVLLYSYCTPTAYRNINKLILSVSLVPFTLTLCTLIHTVRVHLGFTYTCLDGEVYFAIVALLLVVLIVISLWFNLITMKVGSVTTNDPMIDAISRSVEQIHSRVQELNCELLTCGSLDERESILNAITRLRAELLEKQRRYRHEKYSHLLTFYFCKRRVHHSLEDSHMEGYASSRGAPSDLGGPVGTQRLSGTRDDGDQEDDEAEREKDEVDVDERGFLSQVELEAFRCGPALGSGSYGAVHLGILRSGKLVAVKYVNIQNSSEEALSQVKLEVNMLKKLSHPNIVRYYGCCAVHEYMMIFMEFAVAGSLTSIAKSFSGSNESVIGLYTHQILLGLRFLHGKGVVHRDIKGENILVDGFGVVKLADFGCSKVLAGIANNSHVGCDTLVGSPFWMAPEVIRNEPYGTKADIWSVGCTVVEMLNGGDPPWRDDFENVFSVMYYVGSSNEIPSIPENTSELCRDFLKKCFHRDTTKRPSAEELLRHPWFQQLDTSAKLLPKSTSS